VKSDFGEDPFLTEEGIRRLLATHVLKSIPPPENNHWRSAAVLIPLIKTERGWDVLFIVRTNTVADHKGQVAFPGGARDPEDVTHIDTALREAQEEIGLDPDNVRVMGSLPEFFTVSNYLIVPVVGVIGKPFEIRPSIEEVSRVFTIPLDWLANPINYEERPYIRPGSVYENVIFYQRYDGEILWGATARMMLTFLEILGLHPS
jgi:8-oxo-dGTP pyrophosphatase MutT (NUDIX family)